LASDILLAIDNSMDFLNIALSEGYDLLEERHIGGDRHPSEIIGVAASRVLGDHGLSFSELSRLIVTIGPGSFTGIRVALAFSKGISAGLNIPVTPLPTLDVLASALSFMEGSHVCPLIDAKKGEVFAALYRIDGGEARLETEYRSLKPEALEEMVTVPCVFSGTGIAIASPVIDRLPGATVLRQGFKRVTGEDLIREGMKRAIAVPAGEVKPLYCRRSEAEIKFKVSVEMERVKGER
jgi:tRNA threonylcarbamoyladenosine biosynthesis protein TsaB